MHLPRREEPSTRLRKRRRLISFQRLKRLQGLRNLLRRERSVSTKYQSV
jgi:hypothetical protein